MYEPMFVSSLCQVRVTKRTALWTGIQYGASKFHDSADARHSEDGMFDLHTNSYCVFLPSSQVAAMKQANTAMKTQMKSVKINEIEVPHTFVTLQLLRP